ncbi:unnamed protein product, partial [Calicophoron daubneyi]
SCEEEFGSSNVHPKNTFLPDLLLTAMWLYFSQLQDVMNLDVYTTNCITKLATTSSLRDGSGETEAPFGITKWDQ